MPVVGRGDMHGVNVLTGEQLAEVVIDLAIGVVIVVVGPLFRLSPLLVLHVANGDILHVFASQEFALVAGALIADANAGDDNPVASGRTIVGPQGC